ncbi:MAG: YqaJ viral recombinase family protein [Bacillus sp. (in: Bacteria)]|nr:YqaJ viral recombinase family protein [Bacillus sp. (in: firmicutes)]MCM1426451.1 YqaJ viral recombinase family protein [Eubacterium sp.]
MYTKIPVGNLDRLEWLHLRKTGLGGSDAGAVCGLNPYSSPMNVYRDKTCDEIKEKEDNEAIRQGHDLEDYVAARFMEASGLKARRSNYMYRSIENPFMIADVDRLIIGEDAGLECKTVGAYSADKWKDGEIPLHYIMQCYHYMAVTGRRAWYIAAVILGREFVYRRLEWDDALITQLIETEKYFWTEHVEKGVMPAPDGSKACDALLEEYFHTAKKSSPIMLTGFDQKLIRREQILKEIAALEQEQKQIEQEVKLYMKDNEYAVNDKYKVSWSNVENTRLDVKRIRQEEPEIYKNYAKVSTVRRFQIKAA